jgi:hypothetical protein
MTDHANEPDLRFRTPVSPEEAAAVTAVLIAALADQGASPAAEPVPANTGRWVREAGAVRASFRPGPGRWQAWGR